MNDLIICAVAHYSTEQVKIYVESLNKTEFSGDKIMITYDLPQETIKYLQRMGWECYSADLSGHPHMKRLIDIWWFLQNDRRKWRYVISTDVRDIAWQTNPSVWLEKNMSTPLMVASECVTNKNEPWAQKNLLEGYGEIFWNYIKNNIIGNVGVVAGEYTFFKELLMLNWLCSQAGNTRHFTDQSSLNLIINNNLVKDKIKLVTDFALQVGTLSNSHRVSHHKWSILDNELIAHENTPYVLVHQYDRNPTLKKFIESKYS